MPIQQLQLHIYESATYSQRSPNILKTILKKHFQSFSEEYSDKYDTEYGRIRLERIKSFKKSLISCNDYTKGMRTGCPSAHTIFLKSRWYELLGCETMGVAEERWLKAGIVAHCDNVKTEEIA